MITGAGIAVRATHPAHACTPAQVARVISSHDTTLIALANGYDNGFARVWPIGSALLLDHLERAWRDHPGQPEARLRHAIAAATDAFAREAPASSERPEWPGLSPEATLVAVAIDERGAIAAWSGPEQALLVRDGAVIARTTPHSLYEVARAQGVEPPEHLADVVARALISDRDRGQPVEVRALGAIAPGDRCVLWSSELARLARERDDRVTLDAATPQALADALVALDSTRETPFHAACVVGW